jgi:membrane AbrB-like protein
MLGRLKAAAPIGLALLLGSCGGLMFNALGAPLPFMLGAMLTTMVASMAGAPLAMPRWLRNGLAPVLGVLFGSVLHLTDLPAVGDVLLLAGLVLTHLFITIGLGWLYFRWAGIDSVTSYFAAVPGNFSDMVILADQLGANIRIVALVHSARLVIAVATISFGLRYVLGIDPVRMVISEGTPPGLYDLAILVCCAVGGYKLGQLLRLPAPQMFGPLIASAVVHGIGVTQSSPPHWAIAAAQIILGVFAGARFVGVRIADVWRILLLSVVWAFILLAIIAGYATLVAYLLKLHPALPLLAFAPGGFAEISMLTAAAGVSVAFVTVVQLIRMIFTVIVGPMLIGALVRNNISVKEAVDPAHKI